MKEFITAFLIYYAVILSTLNFFAVESNRDKIDSLIISINHRDKGSFHDPSKLVVSYCVPRDTPKGQ